ncbi:MAG: metallophosphoesterase family protein [Alkalispirochaeta sp.]
MRIIQITDLHLDVLDRNPQGVDVWANAEWAFAEARRAQPDAVVVTGDIAFDRGARSIYLETNELFAGLGCPWYLIPGNHDDRSLFGEVFGERYARHGDAPWIDYSVAGPPAMIFVDSADGVVAPPQIAWLRDVLMEVERRVVWIHHPVITGFHRYMDANYPLRNAETVLELLDDGGETTIFCGHYHYEHVARYRRVVQYCTPSTYVGIDPDAATLRRLPVPPGVRVVDIAPDGSIETAVVTKAPR